MKTNGAFAANAKRRRAPKQSITAFRERDARSFKSFTIEEINDLKAAGRR